MASINSVISHSVIANLLRASGDMNTSILNLSGGLKTNASVADFSVGSLLSSQSSTLAIANINAGQGKSLAATAKGALDEILSLLEAQQALATQAADDSLTDNERAILNQEFQDITAEINRIATTTEFNNKALLDGTASGVADMTTATGQAVENYTLLTTADFTMSGTTAAGNLTTSSVFAPIATNSVGTVAGSATLSFVGAIGGVVTNAIVSITGGSNGTITFSSAATAAAAATAFVAAAEASTNAAVRGFTYKDNGDGTVLVKTADLGDSLNGYTFALTNRGTNITANTVTFGGVTGNIDTVGAGTALSLTTAVTKTLGDVRTVAAASITLDANLQGQLTDFAATLDTSGTQNTAIFTTEINGKTYTSQAVTLFGTGGYNSKGNTIKLGQVITFYNADGATDSDGDFTDNAFSLTVGGTDITVSGGTQDATSTALSTIAAGFETQLAVNHINQSRSVVLPVTNAIGGDFTISAADDTLFEGILGFDAVGTNAKGDINFIGDIFGTDGNNSTISPFSFDTTTHILSTTINGEVYSADLSTNAATLSAITTEGLATGTGGSFNSTTNVLTVGSVNTAIVLHSASTTDGRQLRIDLSNVAAGDINMGTAAAVTTFTTDLNTVFGITNNPSLSFQVGVDSSNTIGLSISNSQTTALYKDDAGAGKTLDISTAAGAAQATDVLENAVNNTLSRISTVTSAITSFTSAIVTNNVMINNFDAASSSLLYTDYATETTLLAQATLRYNAAISVLVQGQATAQNILRLLGS